MISLILLFFGNLWRSPPLLFGYSNIYALRFYVKLFTLNLNYALNYVNGAVDVVFYIISCISCYFMAFYVFYVFFTYLCSFAYNFYVCFIVTDCKHIFILRFPFRPVLGVSWGDIRAAEGQSASYFFSNPVAVDIWLR